MLYLKNRYVLFSLLWFAASVYFLFFKVPGSETMPFAHFDKVAHGGLFFGQTWLVGKIWLKAAQTPPWRVMIICLLMWAGLSEILQAFCTLDRNGDIWDALADTCGILAAVYFLKQSNDGRKLS